MTSRTSSTHRSRKTVTTRPASRRTFDLADRLKAIQARSFHAWHIPEPELIFHKHFRFVDPKTGLGLYGPWALNEPGAPSQIRLGLIGTGETVDLAQQWIRQCAHKVYPALPSQKNGKVKDPIMFPAFPGMSSTSSFECNFVIADAHIETLPGSDIDRIVCHTPDFITRVNTAVQLITERLEVLADKPSPPQVVLCALPQEINDYCQGGKPRQGTEFKIKLTPGEKRLKKRMEEYERQGQLPLIDVFADSARTSEADPTHHNFYRALKAKAMATGLPIQVAWPSTFVGTHTNEDDATRAWNFCVGLYYKAGWIPWRVDGLSRGTCYIGVSFYREKNSTKLRTSMTQAFSDQGDGIVLRGEPFAWHDPEKSPHLHKRSRSEVTF